MPAGSRIEGGSIRAGVLMFVAGLALASCAVQVLRLEPTRLHERPGEIAVDEEAGLISVAINYQQ